MFAILADILKPNWNFFICGALILILIVQFFFTMGIGKIEANFRVKNQVLFYVLLTSILYFSVVLYNWSVFDWGKANHVNTLLIRYLLGIGIFIAISMSFSIANYLLHIFNPDAHLISADALKYFAQAKGVTIKEIDNEIVRLNENLIAYQRYVDMITACKHIVPISPASWSEIITMMPEDIFPQAQELAGVWQLDEQQYVLLTQQPLPVFETAGEEFSAYLINKGACQHLITYIEEYSTSLGANLTSLLSNLSFAIQNIETKSIPNLQESKNKLPIGIFIQSFLMEIFSLKQNYITPISSPARILYLVFGLYKYLLLGTFISLLVKK